MLTSIWEVAMGINIDEEQLLFHLQGKKRVMLCRLHEMLI